MFKERMSKIKDLVIKETEESKEGKNNKKKIENLVFFLIILIATLIAMNIILNDDEKVIENTNSEYKQLAQEDKEINKDTSYDELEEKIKNILETISGVRKS